jgi:hypothetical protein
VDEETRQAEKVERRNFSSIVAHEQPFAIQNDANLRFFPILRQFGEIICSERPLSDEEIPDLKQR